MLQVKRETRGKRSEKGTEQTGTNIFVNDAEGLGIHLFDSKESIADLIWPH